MYELNKNQSILVAGGQLNYITIIEEGDNGSIMTGSAVLGIVGAALGGLIGGTFGAYSMLAGAAIGGTTGYGVGYGLTRLMNANMWYDFNSNNVLFLA